MLVSWVASGRITEKLSHNHQLYDNKKKSRLSIELDPVTRALYSFFEILTFSIVLAPQRILK